MSALLRSPEIVPSLFSRGSESDDVPKSARLSARIADRLGSLIAAADLGQAEALVGRTGGALAGTSIAVFLVGLPLLKATSLLAALALAR